MAYVKKRKQAAQLPNLIGVGMDSDGHKRITRGEQFALFGGSKETHEHMTETTIKISEKLRKRGKSLREVSREEFDEIAHEVGLTRRTPDQN